MATELPLPYVPVDPRIEESERFLDFVETLELEDDPRAIVYIVKLLFFAGRQHVDGNLGASLRARRLARTCGWPGDPQQFLDALLEAKWIVRTDDGYVIEGWERHGGRVYHDRVRKRKEWHAKGKPVRKSKPPATLPEVPGGSGSPPATLPEVPATFLLEHEHEHEDLDRSIRRPPPVRLVERRTVLTETHTKQVEVSERPIAVDGFELRHLQEMLAEANLAVGLNSRQQRHFSALPASNRTREHFTEALRLMGEQRKVGKVERPVNYLLTTVGSLPPDLRAARKQQSAAKLSSADKQQLQRKWQRRLGQHWRVGADEAVEFEQLNPDEGELAAALEDAGALCDALHRLRGRTLAHSARREVANGTA